MNLRLTVVLFSILLPATAYAGEMEPEDIKPIQPLFEAARKLSPSEVSELGLDPSPSETYLCVADMATGFAFDKSRKKWHSTDFSTDRKYIVSKSKIEGYAWEVKIVGETITMVFCEDNFNEAGNIFCAGAFEEFRINKNNLRYLKTYLLGYWTDGLKGIKPFSDESFEEGANTPSMEIGKCSPL